MGHHGWGGHGSPWVVLAHVGSVGFDGLAGWLDSGFGYESHGESWLAVGEVIVARRRSPWVGWSWLAMGSLGSLWVGCI